MIPQILSRSISISDAEFIKAFLRSLCLIVLFLTAGHAQTQIHIMELQLPEVKPRPIEEPLIIAFTADPVEPSDKKNDPAYRLYKDGYNLILEEEWEGAKKKLADFIKKYPKSEYVDDAEYWSAYALMHINKKQAAEAYKKFMAKYPHSNYYDDASADLHQLIPAPFVITKSGDIADDVEDAEDVEDGVDSGAIDEHGFTVRSKTGKGFSYSYSIGPKIVERQLRDQMRAFAHVRWPGKTPMPPLGLPRFDEKVDKETQLKMDALHALSNGKTDSLSFRTLRDIAVDVKQPRQVREEAMDVLSGYKKFDALSVYLEIAEKDTSEEIQNVAIDYIGQLSSNKDRSVMVLIDLFSAIPKYRSDRLQNVLWTIGEIGNHRAVNFLSTVAKTHENYDLRRDAIYYLGNIGGDEARKALYEILKGK